MLLFASEYQDQVRNQTCFQLYATHRGGCTADSLRYDKAAS